MSLLSRGEIRNATGDQDGTWILENDGFIKPYRATHGYAVAVGPVFEQNSPDLASVSRYGGLFGTWTDPETGTLHIDRVVHIQGSITDALSVARAFDQACIYLFDFRRSMSVEGKILV